MMLIKDVQRKSLTLKNVLRYRCDTDDSKDMFRYVKDWLLYHQISLSDAYVEIEHGRSKKDDSLLDIELLVPVNLTEKDIIDAKAEFEFLPSFTFNDVVSVYFRGLRLYKRAISRLSAYMKVNNLQPISSVCSRIYHQEDGGDIAAELFVCVEERSIPRDPDMKLTSREKQACFDRAVKLLENKLSEKELCESVYSMSILDINEGIVSLAVENDLILEIVRTKYLPMIEAAFRIVLNMPVALYLTVEDEVYDDDRHEEKIADADLFDEEYTERIFESAKSFMRGELAESVFDKYIEILNCEYITSDYKVVLIADDDKADLIPFINDKYYELLKKSFRYALGGIDVDIRIHTESEIISVLETLIREKESESENNSGSESTLGRIFDILNASRKEYLQRSADMLADELINIPWEYGDKTIFVKGNSLSGDEETEELTDKKRHLDITFKTMRSYINSELSPTTMEEYIDILNPVSISDEEMVFTVPKEEVGKIENIESRYSALIAKAARYALGGKNLKVKILPQYVINEE